MSKTLATPKKFFSSYGFDIDIDNFLLGPVSESLGLKTTGLFTVKIKTTGFKTKTSGEKLKPVEIN